MDTPDDDALTALMDADGNPWRVYPVVTIPCAFGCGEKASAAGARAAHDLLDDHYRSHHPDEWASLVLHPLRPGYVRSLLAAITPAHIFGGNS